MNFSPYKISENFVLKKLNYIKDGKLSLENYDGKIHQFGNQESSLSAKIKIHNPKFYFNIIRGGSSALGESFNFLAANSENKKAVTLGSAIEKATQGILDNNKSPGRKVGEMDNRHSHFFFALYWATALAEQKEDHDLAVRFTSVYNMLKDNTAKILNELDSIQGLEVDLGGYYHPDKEKVAKIMRPSPTMNSIIDDMLPNIKFH